MKTSFANDMTTALSKSFFYCPENGSPSIQVGNLYERSFIFWLKYNDEAINKCASTLIRELGSDLSINNLQSAKKILLDFSSHAFNTIKADYLSLNTSNKSVSDIFSAQQKTHLNSIFIDYIKSIKKITPYIYTLRNSSMKGVRKLNSNLYLYGFGEVDKLLIDIKDKTGIEIPRSLLDEEYIRNEPIGRYHLLADASAALVYAYSKDEAIESLNKLFGALCLTIDAPFQINQLNVDNRINSFGRTKIHTSDFRTNLPAVYQLNITNSVADNLEKMLSSPDKRMNSALSFIAHGWSNHKRERFLNQFIALDALYGTESKNKLSITNGVCRDASSIEDVYSKIKVIYELRSKFVHGEISTFSDHGKYLNFVDMHGTEPITSLFEILKECTLNYGGVYKLKVDKDVTT
ncbi:hypothetical protein [Serratia quinivorans]|uniref:hypothetical protein n=1 Tax=Serratia quinivorans TaxID=137545 RepID=UPI003F70782F